ncbi:MAG: DUF4238 domain-containing protein [Candidatus Hydrogenedentes bacterium]|nr:DUF4238 domain-containing protein [Candidatus Hydrogenedentota bacterium]
MQKQPRKHHFVQAEHIRQFVSDDGIVWIYGKDGKQFHATPEGIFKKKDLNSFDAPDGLDTSFESFVTKIENECWPAIKRTIEKEIIEQADVDRITTYVSLSRMRNPSVQAGIIESRKQILNSTARIMDSRGKFDDIGPNPIDPDRSVSELLDSGSLVFNINNSVYLESVLHMVETFQKVLANGFRWCLVKSPRNRVVLSDHPLTYLHPGKHPGAYGITPGGKSCEMAFPLSKGLYLLGLWENEIDNIECEDTVDELNKRQAIFANRHIASCHKRKWLRNLATRYRSFGFQMLSDSVGPIGETYHIMRSGVYQLPGTKLFKGTHPLVTTNSIVGDKRA